MQNILSKSITNYYFSLIKHNNEADLKIFAIDYFTFVQGLSPIQLYNYFSDFNQSKLTEINDRMEELFNVQCYSCTFDLAEELAKNLRLKEQVQTKVLPTPTKALPTPTKALPTPTNALPTPTNDENKIIEQIKTLVGAKNNGSMDENRVLELIQSELQKANFQKFTIVEYKNIEIQSEFSHPQFEIICNLVSFPFRSLWLNGSAGGGKSYICQEVAKVLNLDFYAKSCSISMQAFEFSGYNDANGNFIETDFYKAFTNGGLFLLDEIDSASPNVLTVLNSCLSNDFFSFANGMQKKHDNFRLVATANTVGNGANKKYVGRLQIDLATKNRFNFLNFERDMNFEKLFSQATESQFYNAITLISKINDLKLDTVFSIRDLKSYCYLVNDLKVDDKEAFKIAFLNAQTENVIKELNTVKI